jgi:hypothetical protein
MEQEQKQEKHQDDTASTVDNNNVAANKVSADEM